MFGKHVLLRNTVKCTGKQLYTLQHRSFSSVELFAQQFPHIKSEQPYRTPIVIIHGLLGSSNNWRGIASRSELSHNRHVYGIDVRNHGQSPHTHSMSYNDMSADIIRMLDKYSIDECILIGHSLGGKIAMTTALTQADRVKQLVVVDMSPAPFTYKTDESWLGVGKIVDACAAVKLHECKSRNDCDAQLQHEIPDKTVRQFVLQNFVRNHTTNEWQWRVNLPAIQAAMPEIAKFEYNDAQKYQFDKPTLFLAGGDSNYIRKEHYQLIHQLFPQSEIQSIDGAGHWLHHTHPQQFLKLCSEFIHKHEKS